MSGLILKIVYDSKEGVIEPWYVRSLELRLCIDELDSVRITLLLTPEGNTTVLKQVIPGQTFTLKIDAVEFEGDFVHVSFQQMPRGLEVTAVGLEALHRLRHQRLSEIKEQTKDKVVSTLLTNASLRKTSVGKVKPAAAEQVLLDDDAVNLLKKLCVERNFALFWSRGTLTYGPRNLARGSGPIKLESASLTDLELDLDLSEVVTGVTVHGRDYRTAKKALKYAATGVKQKKISKGTTATALRKKGLGALVHTIPWSLDKSTASALEESATADLQARAEKFSRGKCVGILNLAIKPLSAVQVENVAWPLGGPALVSAVTHRIEEGNTETVTEFFSDALEKTALSRSASRFGSSMSSFGLSLPQIGGSLLASALGGRGGGTAGSTARNPNTLGTLSRARLGEGASGGSGRSAATSAAAPPTADAAAAEVAALSEERASLRDARARMASAYDLQALERRSFGTLTAQEQWILNESSRLDQSLARLDEAYRSALGEQTQLVRARVSALDNGGQTASLRDIPAAERTASESRRLAELDAATAELDRLEVALAELDEPAGGV